jgi:hypothetical protein
MWNASYQGRWIGCGRPVYLTPMYCFLWGQLKEHIYTVPRRTTEHLGAMFKADVTAVDADVIRCEGSAVHCLRPCNKRKPPSTPTVTTNSGVSRNFVRVWGGGGGEAKNSGGDRGQRERDSGGGSPLVRGSGGSCNLVQEISFHIAKFP